MEPAFSIARFVEDARMVSQIGAAPFMVDWLPNGRTSLVVRVPEDGRGDAYVLGPRTRAKFKRATGFLRATVIQFKPGWSPTLFGVPAHALTDQLISLGDLWLDGEITADLVAARSVPAMLERLSRAVAARTTFESGSAHLARRAARMFEGTETRVAAVAQRLGVTARHLRRAFVESDRRPRGDATPMSTARAVGASLVLICVPHTKLRQPPHVQPRSLARDPRHAVA
jgi:hypothetical protein